MFGIAVAGTHSHSWVMTFPTELEAFEAYAEIYPDNCLLLVDTYDTLKSGVPNAIKVFDRLKAEGHKPVGIRLDSGDLAYLSREARKMLDAAGHADCKIFASNDIDENVLLALNSQDAKIDVYGIGTKLITSFSNASLGGVYKLCAVEEEGRMVPKIKVSDSHDKTTDPGVKKTVRIYRGGMAAADLICLADEADRHLASPHGLPPRADVEAHHFQGFHRERAARRGHQGRRARATRLPTLEEIGRHHDESKAEFFPEYKRVVNTQYYKVDLSQEAVGSEADVARRKSAGLTATRHMPRGQNVRGFCFVLLDGRFARFRLCQNSSRNSPMPAQFSRPRTVYNGCSAGGHTSPSPKESA